MMIVLNIYTASVSIALCMSRYLPMTEQSVNLAVTLHVSMSVGCSLRQGSILSGNALEKLVFYNVIKYS